MSTMAITAALLALFWGFWGLYILVMAVYRAHLSGRMSKSAYVLAFPFVLTGVIVDVAVQWLVAPVIFADLPRRREWTVTARFQRYIANDDGWRYRVAKAVCDGLLDVFDPDGDHC